jgi:hypothetical protein
MCADIGERRLTNPVTHRTDRVGARAPANPNQAELLVIFRGLGLALTLI